MRYKVIYNDDEKSYEKIFENKQEICNFLNCGNGTLQNIMLGRNKGIKSNALIYKFFKIEAIKLTEEEKREKQLKAMKNYRENLSEEKKEEISKKKKENYQKKVELKKKEIINENKKIILEKFMQ